MRLRLAPVATLAVAATFASAHALAAQQSALSITAGEVVGDDRFNFMTGWAFTTSNTITVTALGLWDEGGNGLTRAYQVGIWNAGGTLRVSGTVPERESGMLIDGFRFANVGSTVLSPGSYVIGALYPDDDDRFVHEASVTMAQGITHDGGRFRFGAGFAFPTTAPNPIFEAGYFGPNFRFTTAVIPEPGTWALVGTGLLGLGGLALRRRASA